MSNRVWKKLPMLAACLISLVAMAPASFGQAVYGSLYGTVTDKTGAIVPNATVTVTDLAKGTSVSVTSNDSGAYTVEHLIPDAYGIRVTAQGFKAFETKGIQVSADSSPKVDVSLTIGGATETVEVSAGDIPLLKTDRADISTTFNEKTTSDLPLSGRNFTGLQLLLPGTQILGWSHASSENPQGSQQIIVNGQHFAGVAYELDGTDNQDPILGIIVVNPSLDSVQESKIATQNYDAQFGKAVAAVVTAQTKSGSNKFHGSLFDYRQSDANRAKDPFGNPDKVTKRIVPVALNNQFGASLGGPIFKDKLFFFGDFQGVRSKVGTSTGKLNVPTALLRSSCAGTVGCDFSEYVALSGAPALYDPNPGVSAGNPTGAGGITPFAGNVIPKARLNPAALALLLKYPNPQTAGTKDNYSGVGTGKFNYNQFTARLDQQINSRIHAFGRYSYFKDTLEGGTVFGALGGYGFGTGGFGGTSLGHNQSVSIGTDIVVTPKWLTDIRFGWFRYAINTQKYDGAEAFATTAGIPGLNTGSGNTGGAPGFFFGGGATNFNGQGELANLGSGLGVNRCNCPLTENERQFQLVNNWTHELGNHSIKFGVDARHAYNLRVPSDNNRAGELSFDKRITGSGNSGGVAAATFVLGQVTELKRYVSNTVSANESQNRLFVYAQDTWRASQKLTINYGLRWENYFPERVNQAGNGSILNLNTGNLQIAGQGPYDLGMGVKNANKAFAPRIGVAYQLNNKTVIRSGYGRSFDIGVFGSIFGHAVTQNLPVLAKQDSTSNGYASVFTLGGAPPAANFGGTPVNGDLRLPNGIAANARPITERFPTIDAWNASVQRDLGHQFSVTVAYVGNKGTHTFAGDGSTTDPNQVALTANGLTFNPLYDPSGTGTGPQVLRNPSAPRSDSGDNNRRKYFPLYGWTQGINYFGSEADTHFNALQATLEKRFSAGYQFSVNYAYQVATNYNGDYYNINKKVGYGNQDDLRRNQVTLFGNFELPFGRNKLIGSDMNPVLNYIVGGWQISPVATLSSGLPYWPSYQNCGQDRDAGPCTPNQIGSFSSGKGAYDPAARNLRYYAPVVDVTKATNGVFADPGFGKFGNIKRNSFWGPGFFNADLAVQKSFPIHEAISVLFRVDAFNAFNHINLDNPNNTVDSQRFDPITGKGDPNSLGGGGLVTGMARGASPRQLQFAARIRF